MVSPTRRLAHLYCVRAQLLCELTGLRCPVCSCRYRLPHMPKSLRRRFFWSPQPSRQSCDNERRAQRDAGCNLGPGSDTLVPAGAFPLPRLSLCSETVECQKPSTVQAVESWARRVNQHALVGFLQDELVQCAVCRNRAINHAVVEWCGT